MYILFRYTLPIMLYNYVLRARLHQSLHLVAALISGVTAYLPDCQGLQVEEW